MPAHVKRNYNGPHQRLRAHWVELVATTTVCCWRCRLPITGEWDLGHRPPPLPPHPEHRACNRSAGATEGNRRREPRTNIW